MEAILSLKSVTVSWKRLLLASVISIPILVGGAFAFPLTYLTNSNELIGVCLLPFVLTIQKDNRRSNYLFLSMFLLFACVAWIYNVRMFYFFSLAFYIFWALELLAGAINTLTIFLIGFMSPVFFQISVILGFPIRLQLSQISGTLLQWMGVDVQIEGNMMLLNGATFTVDEACMGLSMLAISMLMGVFIVAHVSRTLKKSLKLKYLIVFFGIGFLLNVVTNLFRIILLVLFKIAPEHPMHEIVGLLCMIVYIVIPLYVLGQWLVAGYGNDTADVKRDIPVASTFATTGVIVLSLGLMIVGIHIGQLRSQSTVSSHAKVSAPGYTITRMDDGVTKLVNHASLLYIKPIPEFFSGEHTPLICWKGSGYTFKNTTQATISGREIYYGRLIKDEEALYTAWWYDNGTIQTVSQFDWRVRMMRGEEKFSLINVTTSDEQTLKGIIQSIFENKLLHIQHETI